MKVKKAYRKLILLFLVFSINFTNLINAQYDNLNVIPQFFGDYAGNSQDLHANTASLRSNVASNVEQVRVDGVNISRDYINLPTSTSTSTSRIQHYDPFLENKLRSPNKREGMFGLLVKEVENYLISLGAKPYSYAFGKYSRLKFSVYMITMLFDKNRKLGGLIVTPIPPFRKIEYKFKEFIIKTFLSGADISKFETIITNNKIEIWYEDNRRFSSTIIELLEQKNKENEK